MHIVVSRWNPKPGKESDFEAIGHKMRGMLRSQPGVRFVEGFKGPETYVVVHAYEDEGAYKRIVEDPNGPFAKAAAENRIEEVADWVDSISGASLG